MYKKGCALFSLNTTHFWPLISRTKKDTVHFKHEAWKHPGRKVIFLSFNQSSIYKHKMVDNIRDIILKPFSCCIDSRCGHGYCECIQLTLGVGLCFSQHWSTKQFRWRSVNPVVREYSQCWWMVCVINIEFKRVWYLNLHTSQWVTNENITQV